MRFLLDTNCWMQMIREREHAVEVGQLVNVVGDANLATTDFAFHSVAIAMQRHKMLDRLKPFIELTGLGTRIELIRTKPEDLFRVADICQLHGLDVDDAYQYVAAEIHGLKLVSLDTDFDRTPNGRLTPADARRLFTDDQNKQSKEA